MRARKAWGLNFSSVMLPRHALLRVNDISIRQPAQALLGDRRAAEVFADSFEAFSVGSGDSPRQMKTVAAFGGGEDLPAGQPPLVGTGNMAPSAWGWLAGG
jgi:hypothetical protein